LPRHPLHLTMLRRDVGWRGPSPAGMSSFA
jgi:hypothetical protein